MCVYIYVYIYICIYIYVYIYTRKYTYIYICIHICMYIYMCIHICKHIYIYIIHIRMYIYIYTYVCVYIYTYTYHRPRKPIQCHTNSSHLDANPCSQLGINILGPVGKETPPRSLVGWTSVGYDTNQGSSLCIIDHQPFLGATAALIQQTSWS